MNTKTPSLVDVATKALDVIRQMTPDDPPTPEDLADHIQLTGLAEELEAAIDNESTAELRDYFAGCALASIPVTDRRSAFEIAAGCYRAADKMIEARGGT